MKIKFFKMHGIENDYIFIDCLNNNFPVNIENFTKYVSNRHSGIGSDGVILIEKSDVAVAKMRIFNADGSEGKMCGNAIRCVAKYLYENGISSSPNFKIDSLSGVKNIHLETKGKNVSKVNVEMGKASFEGEDIGMRIPSLINETLEILGKRIKATAVSIGNPHCVIFVKDFNFDYKLLGKAIENDSLFKDRTNVEFVVRAKDGFFVRVWERGSGETRGCGTGACAVASVACKLGIAEFGKDIPIHLLGGTLNINCSPDFDINMEGPAEFVYRGEINFNNVN